MKTIPQLGPLGRYFLKLACVRILIVDDNEAYFPSPWLTRASSQGYGMFERLYFVKSDDLDRLLATPPDIIIMDVRGVVDKSIAKDGIGLAKIFKRDTHAFVCLTSAHYFHFKNAHRDASDRYIEARNLTYVDFVSELDKTYEGYLGAKIKLWRKLALKTGFALLKHGSSGLT
jgi:hypothetical protein